MDHDFERRLSNGRAGFPAMLEAIETFLENAGVSADTATKLMIAFDEVISNILNHGASAADPQISVRLVATDSGITAEVRDDGPAFDPLSLPAPDTTLPLEQRPIGGLGIHLVRELMDNVEYFRDGEMNLLRFAKTCTVR